MCGPIGTPSRRRSSGRSAPASRRPSTWTPATSTASPLLVLAGFATRTERIRLGTDVVVLPFYHPTKVAEDAAMLDVISGGRLTLGVAIGYRPDEFAMFGMDHLICRLYVPGMPHEHIMQELRLLAREVMPAFVDGARVS